MREAVLKRCTPIRCRKGYSLHRRRQERDHYGELRNRYDMETPDLVVQDGAEDGICFQDARTWQVGGQLSGGAEVGEPGERYQSVLQGALFTDLEVSVFDRFRIDGEVYELRKVQRWYSYRLLSLQRIF